MNQFSFEIYVMSIASRRHRHKDIGENKYFRFL